MNNLIEDKQKALRIYGAICEDFDTGHYSSCVNLIKKNRELLSSFLSPAQDEKIYKIYAYSIFTLIEDNYLAGNVEAATGLVKNYEALLDAHLSHDAKKALEGYKTGEIPEIGSDISKEDVRADERVLKDNIEHTKSAWTVTDNDFGSVLKNADEDKNSKIKKGRKLGFLVAALMALVVALGIVFATPLLDFILDKNLPATVINDSDSSTLPNSEDEPGSDLEIVEPPPAPPVEQMPDVSIPTDPNSLISPNVKVDANGYVLPTDSKIISAEDLSGFDQKMVRLATNEMFARKGFAFSSTGEYYNFFCQFEWYSPNPDVTIDQAEAMFSETEKANLLTLLNFNS